ncbi:MAG: acyl-ACP--UDP-N-acetylglucosamine O-acyltransferase [Chthoniobacterales bacterium]|nr:acyl-ACP--UDP-N-acetylglucosamine O-acyltransferase [Chthoniobacterales bacterium]
MSEPQIHPTAIIDSKVKIGKNVIIGPYAIVEGDIEISDNCKIAAHAILQGPLFLGPNCSIGFGTHLGGEPQDFAYKPGTTSYTHIGARNVIREYVTIHRGTKENSSTTIGDDNFLMVGVHIGHNCTLGNNCILANNVLLAGYTEFGNRVVVGGDVVFHQFMRVGDLAMVRGGTAWSKSIPPYTIGGGKNLLAGINIVGLRRAAIPQEIRTEIATAYKLLYRTNLNFSQALEKASSLSWSPQTLKFWDFVRSPGKLGLAPARQRGQRITGIPDE